jgi:tetratricopeptide (TPR) repeat protein
VRLRSGRSEEAAALAREATLAEPLRPLPRELLAEALEAGGDLAGALEAAAGAAALAAADGESWALLGRLRALAGLREGALEAFREGVRRDPWSFECVRRAAMLEGALGDLEGALSTARRYLEETGARAAEVVPVLPSVGPEAAPSAPPPATLLGFPSELAYREALRRRGPRRSHVVAAARYQARLLAARALLALGREAEAAEESARAPGEVEGVSRILLLEAGLDLGE